MIITHYNSKKHVQRDIIHVNVTSSSFLDVVEQFKSYKQQNVKDVLIDVTKMPMHLRLGIVNRYVQMFLVMNEHKSIASERNIYIKGLSAPSMSLVKSSVLAMEISNQPANVIYPESFCNLAQEMFKDFKNTKVTYFTDDELVKRNLNLIVAMGKGSQHSPCMLIIELNPNSMSKPVCIVGKGVTFDSGGYDIKSKPGMYSMHLDKTGATIALNVMHYYARTKSKKHIVAVIPLIENALSHTAVMPGTVIKSYNGLTVEIVDTDAEGRIILADALAYACKIFRPSFILDIATLTSWSSKLHCHTSYAYFTMNANISALLEPIGSRMYERNMRIPSWPEYIKYTKSDIADVKNYNFTCNNSDGFMAPMFLLNFIPKKLHKSWLHMDIKYISFHPSYGLAEGFLSCIEVINKLL